MKLRVRGNSLRIRLTQPEVRQLSGGAAVEDHCVLSPLSQLSVAAEPWHLDVFSAAFEEDKLTVRIPQSAIASWAETDDEGIYATLDNGTSEGLRIAVEKDYSCLSPRPEESYTEQFPNPDSGKRTC
jgi:hypothetical protein